MPDEKMRAFWDSLTAEEKEALRETSIMGLMLWMMENAEEVSQQVREYGEKMEQIIRILSGREQ